MITDAKELNFNEKNYEFAFERNAKQKKNLFGKMEFKRAKNQKQRKR